MDTREQLIDTAVKFLKNPKVIDTPLAKRKEFLKKKGLTDEEISNAVSKAGIVSDVEQEPYSPVGLPVLPPPAAVQIYEPWRWRGITGLVLLIAGATYGVYRLLLDYIIPWLRGKVSADAEARESMQSLRETVDRGSEELRQSVEGVRRAVSEQSDRLECVVNMVRTNPASSSQESVQLTQLKSEITSLKGLLVNRNVFPPIPRPSVTVCTSGSTGGTSSVPVTLPAWQQVDSTDTTTSGQGEGGEDKPTPAAAGDDTTSTTHTAAATTITNGDLNSSEDTNDGELCSSVDKSSNDVDKDVNDVEKGARDVENSFDDVEKVVKDVEKVFSKDVEQSVNDVNVTECDVDRTNCNGVDNKSEYVDAAVEAEAAVESGGGGV